MIRQCLNDAAVIASANGGGVAPRHAAKWWLALGAALALCLPVALAPEARAFGTGNTGTNGKSEGGGDEGIGSLPSMAGGPGLFTPGGSSVGGAVAAAMSKLDAGAPNLWIDGPLAVIEQSVQAAWGKGYATIQMARDGQHARVYFHGQVKVAVDPAAFESGLLSAGVWLSPTFQGGIASVEWNGAWSTPIAVGGNVDLPIAAAAHIGVFRDGGATLHLGAPKSRKHSSLAIHSQHGLLVFSQSTH